MLNANQPCICYVWSHNHCLFSEINCSMPYIVLLCRLKSMIKTNVECWRRCLQSTRASLRWKKRCWLEWLHTLLVLSLLLSAETLFFCCSTQMLISKHFTHWENTLTCLTWTFKSKHYCSLKCHVVNWWWWCKWWWWGRSGSDDDDSDNSKWNSAS